VSEEQSTYLVTLTLFVKANDEEDAEYKATSALLAQDGATGVSIHEVEVQ
jgi:hypothetical protein